MKSLTREEELGGCVIAVTGTGIGKLLSIAVRIPFSDKELTLIPTD